MSLFDLVVNTKAGEDELEAGEEDAFAGIGGGSSPQSMPSTPSMSMPSSIPMEMPSFSAPTSEAPSMSMPSSPSMGDEPPMMSMPGGFVPPGGMAAVDNKPQSHSAVKPVTKDDDSVIRIVIDDSLKRAEREKLELEQLEQQQKEHQLLATTIDPSVLVEEEVQEGSNLPSGHDIFANFNASGLRSIISASEEPDPNDHPSNIRDERSYDQIKDKLSDLSDQLASKSSISVDKRLLDRGVDIENLENTSTPGIKVPGGLNVLGN